MWTGAEVQRVPESIDVHGSRRGRGVMLTVASRAKNVVEPVDV